jgi:hypothetical protein
MSKNYYQGFINSFFVISIICYFIYIFLKGESAYGVLLTFYSVFTLGLLLILFQKIYNKNSFFFIFFILIMVIIIIYNIFLIITYKDRIESGNLSSGFTMFHTLTNIFLLIQSQLILSNHILNNLLLGLLLFFSVLMGICCYITSIILIKFTADGFTSLR